MYLSLYCKVSKRLTQGLTVRGSWTPNRTAIYWPPLLWPSALCLSRSPGLLNRRPGGPLCWVRAFSPVSCHQQVSKLAGGPEGPFCRWWLTLPQSCLQLVWAPTHWLPVSPSYIIVQSPTQSLEWHVWSSSREITVMQFKGHSLPVHQFMSVPWDSYLDPLFHPSPPTRFLLITAIGMCHFLPVHHFGMACLAGSKVYI